MFITIFSLPSNAQSQVPLSKESLSSTFSAYKLDDFEVGTASDTNVWIVQDADLMQRPMTIKYRPVRTDSASQMKSVLRNQYYFNFVSRDTLVLNGFENNWTKINYLEPIVIMPFPAEAERGKEGLYYGCGIYCEKKQVKEYGTYFVTLNASGSLVLPEGDTIPNVKCYSIRKKFTRYYYDLSSDMENIKEDTLKRLALDSMVFASYRNGIPQEEEVLLWYKDGYAYPIIEGHRLPNEHAAGKSLNHTFFYTPLSEQVHDAELAKNEEKRNAQSKANKEGYAYGNGSRIGNITSRIVQNKSPLDYCVEINLPESADVSYSLYNTSGICIQKIDRGMVSAGRYFDTFTIKEPMPGTYILSVLLNDNVSSSLKINTNNHY